MGENMEREGNRFYRPAAVLLVALAFSIPFSRPALAFEKLYGVVVQADADAQSLFVLDSRNGRNLEFRVTDRTLIKDGDDHKQLSDLTNGTLVLILYEESGEELDALTITIRPPEE